MSSMDALKAILAELRKINKNLETIIRLLSKGSEE